MSDGKKIAPPAAGSKMAGLRAMREADFEDIPPMLKRPARTPEEEEAWRKRRALLHKRQREPAIKNPPKRVSASAAMLGMDPTQLRSTGAPLRSDNPGDDAMKTKSKKKARPGKARGKAKAATRARRAPRKIAARKARGTIKVGQKVTVAGSRVIGVIKAVLREPGARSPQKIADFMARPQGASMAELEKEFGIDAHPMRSKIFAARHDLGYTVAHEKREGDTEKRYYATPPKAE